MSDQFESAAISGFNRKTLGKMIEECHRRFCILSSQAPDDEVHEDADATWVLSSLDGGSNTICVPRFSQETVGPRLNYILGEYFRRSLRPGVACGPSAVPEELPTHLTRLGLHCFCHIPAMARILNAPIAVNTAGLRINQIESHAIFHRWDHPHLGSVNDPRTQAALAARDQLLVMSPSCAWFITALLNDKPVGVATVIDGGAVAGLFDVSVLEEHRNNGIGGKLVEWCCKFAQDRKFHAIVLLSSDRAVSLYERLGFEEVFKMQGWYLPWSA